MTAAEKIRHAAEYLQDWANDDKAGLYACTKEQARIVTAAFLALVPADDEQAIDEAWLGPLPVADTKRLSYRIGQRGANLLIYWCPACGDLPPLLCVNLTAVTENPTRGDLRRLAAALGIQLKGEA